MKIHPRAIQCVACVVFLAGCGASSRAPRTSAGEPVEIMVLCDQTCPTELSEGNQAYFVRLTQWMGRDLVNRLTKSGYKAVPVETRDEFEPREGRYLLTTKNTGYSPGSKAARALVGFGAGFATLDVHYEFYGMEAQPLMEWDDGASTGRVSLTGIAKKIDQHAVERITEMLVSSKTQ